MYKYKYIDSFRSLNQKNKMFIALFGLTLELGIQAKFILLPETDI
jgi:hypothetical protein